MSLKCPLIGLSSSVKYCAKMLKMHITLWNHLYSKGFHKWETLVSVIIDLLIRAKMAEKWAQKQGAKIINIFAPY
jgi:hypothetical protein